MINRTSISRREATISIGAVGIASLTSRSAHARGGSIKIGISALPPGLGNPLSSLGFPALSIWPAVFDTLVQVDARGDLVPSLALSWEPEGEQSWLISLRPGVQFSNGEACDAKAIVATFGVLNSPQGRTQAVYRDAKTIARAEVVDPLTVRLHTVTPDAALPGKLTGIRILPPDYFSETGFSDFARAPVGTGPFMAERWDQRSVELVPNPLAWRPPVLDRISILPVPGAVGRLQALLSGGVDIAMNINPEDGAMVEMFGGRTKITARAAVLALQFILEKKSPLTDARVRRALNLAVNRRQITEYILAGATVPATQLAVPEAFGYAPGLPLIEHDLEQAQMLMAEAGYADGFRLPMTMTLGSSPNDTAVFQQVAADLARIGVELVIKTIPLGQFSRFLYDGDWGDALAFAFHYGSMPSLDSTIGLRFNSCLWPVPWVCDPTISDLVLASDQIFNQAKRKHLLQDIQRRLVADLPCLILHETRFQNGLSGRISQFDAPFGLIDYATLRVRI
ncbi:MAG: ABC transporter substrate-binding protein [Rhodospirillales bacterium]|jgi:peptide/nickel transport system substrate-binding protein